MRFSIAESEVVLPKKKEKNSYFNEYNKIINDKSKVLNFITNDIRKNQEQYEKNSTVANLSLFSEKEHLLELINRESKLNYICYAYYRIFLLLIIYLQN